MIFYIVLAFMAVWVLQRAYVEKWVNGNEAEQKTGNNILFVVIIWTFFATFRLVEMGAGGKDAAAYKMFFEDCLNPIYTDWMEHVAGDYGYLWLNKIVRTISNDYRVLFAVVYGLIAWAFLSFINFYMPRQISYAPFILAIFPYWIGFNTLRSTFAAAILLMAMIAVGEKKWVKAIVIAVFAASMHKMIALYALCIIFCWAFKNRDLKVHHVILMIVLSSAVAKIFQPWFIQYTEEVDLSGAYGAYARTSLETDFMDNFWKIAFEQMVLGAAMVVYYKRTQRLLADEEDDEYRWKMHAVWLMCAFDMIMIPVSYIMGIWRAYEVFYMPRIVMWAWLIGMVGEHKYPRYKLLLDNGALLLMLAWLIFRFYRIYPEAALMPYIFDWEFFSLAGILN